MRLFLLTVFSVLFWFIQTSFKFDEPKFTVQQYIEKYSSVAIEEMLRSRIPASITLAQGLLESGNGNSRLAVEANNHFGIKCKSTWTGPTIFEDDDAPQECFRKYENAIESYRDHTNFLLTNSRYAFLFDLSPTDYKAWAYGLKKAGYATNPQYAELLIAYIEKHKLHQYDKPQVTQEEIKEVEEEKAMLQKSHGKEFAVNGVKAIRALNNESLTQIALDYEIKVNDLYRYNDFEKDAVLKEGDTIYLEPKKARGEQDFYIAGGSETLWLISQRTGVKGEKLADRNFINLKEIPQKGQKVYLRSTRPDKILLANPTGYQVKVEPKTEQPKIDTLYNNKVYDNAEQNIATQIPASHSDTATMHEFKENLSFFHTVQKGETIYGIGKRYGVSVEAIKYINLLEGDSIEIGQRLIINPAIKEVFQPQIIPGVHVVRQKETLYSIARQYGLEISEVKATNNLSSDSLKVGQQLVIVPKPVKINEVKKEKDKESRYHTVEKGETLYSISRKYNVSVEALKELNYPLNNQLQPFQKIRIE